MYVYMWNNPIFRKQTLWILFVCLFFVCCFFLSLHCLLILASLQSQLRFFNAESRTVTVSVDPSELSPPPIPPQNITSFNDVSMRMNDES